MQWPVLMDTFESGMRMLLFDALVALGDGINGLDVNDIDEP